MTVTVLVGFYWLNHTRSALISCFSNEIRLKQYCEFCMRIMVKQAFHKI